MFKIISLIFGLLISPALAQFGTANAQNTTCATRPAGDNSNACANTQWVNQNTASTALPHTWTAPQAFFTTTASRSVNTTSNNSLLSANLGPAGLALWPYDGFAAINYQNYVDSSSHVGSSFATAGTFTTFTGSTANGPANSNISHMFGCQKLNYLSSSVEGETDCIYLGVQQGAKGDAAAIAGGVDKVQGSGSDTGGALAFEFSTRWVNSSGVVQKDIHILGGFQEGAGGVSNGGGYGYFAEAFKGAQFAAFFAGTYDGYTSTHTWDYVTYATYDRLTNNRYYAVRGNGSLTGSQQPGEIIQGAPGAQKILRTNSDGSFTIRNTADNADLFKVTNAGAFSGSGFGSGVSTALGIAVNTAGGLATDAATSFASLATVGTLTTGTWSASVIAGQYGGTGVANTGKTITLGASLTTTGTGAPTLAFPSSTYTYTFPASSGTLAELGLAQTWSALQTYSAGLTVSAGTTTLSALSTAGLVTNTAAGALGTVTGTDNYVPHWSSGTLASGLLFDNGSGIAVNNASVIGGALFGVHLTTNQNAVFYGSVNGGVALQAINDAASAFANMTVTGAALYLVGGSSTVTVSNTGVAYSAPTGTPVASLCLDASNNIIKKTTAGSCI